MSSWITHLRITDILLDRFSKLLPVQFICGSLAPDSGVLRPGDTKFDPPKSVSHFQFAYGLHNLSGWHIFAERYLSSDALKKLSPDALAFYLGYFSHLYTDHQWSKYIAIPLADKAGELYYKSKSEVTTAWKRDWYDLDFKYLRDNGDPRSFALYRSIEGFSMLDNVYLDFFPRNAFILAQKRITQFYSKPPSELDRDYPFTCEKTVDDFVVKTAHEACSHMEKILLCGGDRLQSGNTMQ